MLGPADYLAAVSANLHMPDPHSEDSSLGVVLGFNRFVALRLRTRSRVTSPLKKTGSCRTWVLLRKASLTGHDLIDRRIRGNHRAARDHAGHRAADLGRNTAHGAVNDIRSLSNWAISLRNTAKPGCANHRSLIRLLATRKDGVPGIYTCSLGGASHSRRTPGLSEAPVLGAIDRSRSAISWSGWSGIGTSATAPS